MVVGKVEKAESDIEIWLQQYYFKADNVQKMYKSIFYFSVDVFSFDIAYQIITIIASINFSFVNLILNF